MYKKDMFFFTSDERKKGKEKMYKNNIILLIFSILFAKSNIFDAACMATTTLTPIQRGCTVYSARVFTEQQTNIIQLTDVEDGDSPSTTDSVYTCCNVCSLNKNCSAFLYYGINQSCKQYKLVVKNEGGLRSYLKYSEDYFAGGIIEDVEALTA